MAARTAGAKDGGGGKEPKDGRDGKEKKNKDGGDGTAALLRRLADEVSALRAEVESVKQGGGDPPPVARGGKTPRPKTAPDTDDALGDVLTRALRDRLAPPGSGDDAPAADAAVLVAHAFRAAPGTEEAGTETGIGDGVVLRAGLDALLAAAPDAAVARLGLAFSSAPKVALIRALLGGGARSAAQLGEAAGLTTGSLYHHLRELTHADVIAAAGRNRFALTPAGRRAALALFALTAAAGTE